ncbi:ABC transporter permease [Actinoalloteichus hymeniacidonis]|uniref:Transport permease protein n=1 Tax=Actinoalloteichus hymeniacidonis TaxID=340345 RepID=A0AAC9N044_9PSEU|nr:ABC transporter permease [Actinoalloteichus hymeniacidonis]AOS65025.1 ABC-type multidrug transport system, permease component [Actinoalloteichus hymeniacidonis]MBB5906896.1 ABC-2 type transport system permease protein [Actinoalloteichus hymeniacidonis]
MSALSRLTGTETKLFFREPISVIFVLGFPPILLVVFGVIPSLREPSETFGGARAIDVYTPIVVAIAIATLALTSLPQQLATYREKGVLRRMRTTPVAPPMLLGAHLLMSVLMSLSTMLVVLTIGRVAFAVNLPQQPIAYPLAYVLAAVAMLSIGLLVAALAPTGTSASAIGLLLFFPIVFFAGLWVPRDSMNDLLRTISDFTPLGAGVQALQDASVGGWPQPLHIAVMLGWTIVAGGLAARYFRWE